MVFLTFFSLSLNFATRSWATVSSPSCFSWLYVASPSLATNNVINVISVLTIWWCPCVKLSLVLLKKCISMTSEVSRQNSVSLYPASFCSPRPNLPVTPGISFVFLLCQFYWWRNWDSEKFDNWLMIIEVKVPTFPICCNRMNINETHVMFVWYSPSQDAESYAARKPSQLIITAD